MKSLLVTIGLLISVNSFCQKYDVGLIKNGTRIQSVEGQILISDSTVVSTFDGQSSTLKIASRKGFVIHVAEGESLHKYVISPKAGRLHGFSYSHSITYELDKRHSKTPPTVFLCVVNRGKN
ncbi:MAG: hypothetical protein WDN75_08420 [Bacteroidota bacterium]